MKAGHRPSLRQLSALTGPATRRPSLLPIISTLSRKMVQLVAGERVSRSCFFVSANLAAAEQLVILRASRRGRPYRRLARNRGSSRHDALAAVPARPPTKLGHGVKLMPQKYVKAWAMCA